MVLRMKTVIKKHGIEILIALVLTAVIMFPYLIRGFLPIEHDTFFHVSRIENLSKEIAEGNFLPALYPYENGGYGYASPLFYCDLLLIPAALMHLAGLPLTVCYTQLVCVFTFFSCLSMYALSLHITKSRKAAWISAAAYLFSNYHITDIYVRGALGETMALAPLPLVILAMYRIMYEKDRNAWHLLAGSLAVLVMCHNLTFLFGCLLCVIIFAVYIRNLDKEIFITLCKGVGLAFLVTCFYTIPLIEQLLSQKFIVGIYASSSNLGAYSMAPWQYLANKTVFGLAGNTMEPSRTMLENIGLFLTFVPVFYLTLKQKHPFILFLLAAGYICMILPGSWISWDLLVFARVIQFPWRLNTVAMLFLAVPAGAFCAEILPKYCTPVLICVLAGECVWHVSPVLSRTFGMQASQTWNDVLDGALCDPYYSAYYVRVELAGADYLPVNAPDFRGRGTQLRDENGVIEDLEYQKFGNRMLIKLEDNIPQRLILPLTWYKGYVVTRTYEGMTEIIPAVPDSEAMVSFHPYGPGTYVCMYAGTPLRNTCMSISWITLVLYALFCYDSRCHLGIVRRLYARLPMKKAG